MIGINLDIPKSVTIFESSFNYCKLEKWFPIKDSDELLQSDLYKPNDLIFFNLDNNLLIF